MHLDDEQLQRMLHGELGGADRSLNEHVSTCADCRARLAAADQDERWVFHRLRLLDHAPPPVSLERILVPVSTHAPVRRRWAAGIVLLLTAAGVAYAAPGSPLPRMVQRIMAVLDGSDERQAGLPIPAPAKDDQAGLAVDPGRRLTIVLGGDRLEGVAFISLSDSSEVIIRAAGGTTTFTSDIDRVTVSHSGLPATIEILVPRHAPRIEIYAGGQRIFLKRDSSLVTTTRPDRTGRYRLPLNGPSP